MHSNIHRVVVSFFLVTVGFLGLVDYTHASYTYNSGCGATNDNGSSHSVTCFASTQNNNGGGNIDDTSTVTVWVPSDVDSNGIYVSTAYARDTGYYSGPGFSFSVGSCGSGNTCGGAINAHVSANSTFSANIRRIGPNGYSRAELTFIMPKVVPPVAPTVTFGVGINPISYNTPAYLSWSATGVGVDYCTASNGWTGQKVVSGSNVSTGNLTTTTTFSIQCHGTGGLSSVQSVTVNVLDQVIPVPTISNFNVNPTTVSYNSPTYLSWNTSGNVDYCEASNGWSGNKPTSGSNTVTGNLATTTTFTLRCHGTGGRSPYQSVMVDVNAPVVPTFTFSANTTSVAYNTPVYLSWNASGLVDYCEASNGWSGQRPTSGSNVAVYVTGTTTLT
ncbi:MAG: hypothetical protein AAB611_01700, partial [Patescibacteria group bacterium]